MTVNRTTLLDLPLPVTGTEAGTWGDVTNNGLTQYLDVAIAGMSNLTSANFTTGALTIETTEGDSIGTNITATSAQYAGFRVSSLAQNSIITVGNTGTNPARSYRLINADATYTLTFKATGQNGITLQPGQTAVVAFNGTDYVIVGMAGAGTVTDNAVVRFDGTTGKLVQNSVVTIADSTGDISGVGTLNATTADLTNLEVTNLKAKDGTAAGSIADSTGVLTITNAPVVSALTASQAVFTTAGKALVSNAITGTGNVVMSTSPTLVTPVLGTPTSGTLSNCTVDGTDAVGFRNTPVNSQSTAYTLVLADSGKTILHPASDNNARTFTIPANSSVAYPVGTAITFVNLINTVTIAITTDTLYLAGDGSTGSRTLAAYGVASAVKVASTTWIISGNGLT